MSIGMPEVFDVVWIDDQHEFTEMEFVALSGLSVLELQHLMDCDALQYRSSSGRENDEDDDADAAQARFSGKCLTLAHAASRLRRDFDLDANGLTLALRLLNRIHELEADLLHLRAQGPGAAR